MTRRPLQAMPSTALQGPDHGAATQDRYGAMSEWSLGEHGEGVEGASAAKKTLHREIALQGHTAMQVYCCT